MNSLERKATPVMESPLPAPSNGDRTAHSPSSSPKLGRWMIGIIILLLALVVAGLVPRWLHTQALAKETVELATPTVQVVSAAPGAAVSTLKLPAEVQAFVAAPIYARANGYVKHWYVDIGTAVEAGKLLADIDTPELDQQLTGARAELVQAQAAESLAQITADRWTELMKTSSVSAQEDAEKQGDLKLKIAAVDTAKANVERLADLQSFSHVTAPFNGTITTRDIDVGDLIMPGKELFRLAETSKLRVFVRVPQSATPGIATGVDAELTVPELPGRTFTAKVVRTAGAIDASSRTLLVELEVNNPKNEIFAGSYAEVSFPDVKQAPSLVLPANTLLFRDAMQVGVVGANNKVELRNVGIGRDFGKTVEIVSGITAQDKIIINPVDSLTSGITVRVAETPVAEKAQ
ncbi:MAG TPA: efflux RND transporter periplasmic adaptor subunit [Verrucomicrobiae bacterium]|jgi:RND family efflux transporter MFP subunit|nr:efflux RND transporter periplasmic adaptor subunit [Verrucomicrobiae bacterium]